MRARRQGLAGRWACTAEITLTTNPSSNLQSSFLIPADPDSCPASSQAANWSCTACAITLVLPPGSYGAHQVHTVRTSGGLGVFILTIWRVLAMGGDNHLLKSTNKPWLNSFNDIPFRFLQITIMVVVVA